MINRKIQRTWFSITNYDCFAAIYPYLALNNCKLGLFWFLSFLQPWKGDWNFLSLQKMHLQSSSTPLCHVVMWENLTRILLFILHYYQNWSFFDIVKIMLWSWQTEVVCGPWDWTHGWYAAPSWCPWPGQCHLGAGLTYWTCTLDHWYCMQDLSDNTISSHSPIHIDKC